MQARVVLVTLLQMQSKITIINYILTISILSTLRTNVVTVRADLSFLCSGHNVSHLQFHNSINIVTLFQLLRRFWEVRFPKCALIIFFLSGFRQINL